MLSFISFCSSAEEISSCQKITKPGEYVLNSDVYTTANCFEIYANNATLDCRGHKIFTNKPSGLLKYGIILRGKNITVKNCRVFNFTEGIVLSIDHSKNCQLINNTANFNYRKGIGIYTDDNIIINNTVNFNSGYGIFIRNGYRNKLINNTANFNGRFGIGTYQPYYNEFINNIVNSNGEGGIKCYRGNYIILKKNKMCNNSRYDFWKSGCTIIKSSENICNKTAGDKFRDEGVENGCRYRCGEKKVCYCDSYSSCDTALENKECEIVRLTKNITSRYSFNIYRNNTILDCNGYNIIGFQDGKRGISSENKKSITIKNCIFQNWSYGIYLFKTNDSRIENVSFLGNNTRAIYLLGSDNNKVTNVSFIDTKEYNIYSLFSNKNNFENLFFGESFWYDKGSQYNIYLSYSDNNTIVNAAKKHSHGILKSLGINQGRGNIIKNSVFLGGWEIIEITNSNKTILENITAKSGRRGVLINGGQENKIINSKIEGSGYEQIRLDYGTIKNLIKNVEINNTKKYSRFGILIGKAEENIIENSKIFGSRIKDIEIILGKDKTYSCDNKIINVTDDKNIKFIYLNYLNNSGSLENKKTPELILCSVNNFEVKNITITQSEDLKRNGIFVYNSTNILFKNIKSDKVHTGLSVENSDSIFIKDSEFKESYYNEKDDPRAGIALRGVSNFVVENVSITGNRKGILLNGFGKNGVINALSTSGRVENSRIENNLQTGITIRGKVENLDLINLKVLENKEWDIDPVLHEIKNCEKVNFENVIGSGNRKIEFYGGSDFIKNKILSELIVCGNDIIIENVTINGSDNLKNNGLLVDGKNIILRNISSSNNYYGISIMGNNISAFDSVLNNNIIGFNSGKSGGTFLKNITAIGNKEKGISAGSAPQEKFTIDSCTTINNTIGIFSDISDVNITNSTIIENKIGIKIYDHSKRSVLENNIIKRNNEGIRIDVSNSTIKRNLIENNSKGIVFYYHCKNNNCDIPDNFKVYNNLFNNTINTFFEIQKTFFDVLKKSPQKDTKLNGVFNDEKRSGEGIMGLFNVGGNYWAYPNGTGFSEICDDKNNDGFCDIKKIVFMNYEQGYLMNYNDYYPISKDSESPRVDIIPSDEEVFLNKDNIIIKINVSDRTSSWIELYLYNESERIVDKINFKTKSAQEAVEHEFSELDNGVYYINASVIDGFGNKNSTKTIKVVIDNETPEIEFTSPTPENNTITNKRYIEINLTTLDKNLKNSIIFIYNSKGELVKSNTSIESTFFWNITNLEDDEYYINATSYDKSENKNSTETRKIIIDTTPPKIKIIHPLNKTYDIDVVELNYTARDDIGLDTCWYSTDLGITNTTITCGQNITGLTSNEGKNTWIVWANDTIGNENYSKVVFTKDTTIPILVVYSPKNITYKSSEILINFTASDLSKIDTLWYYNGTNNITYTSPHYININEGHYTYIFYANDSAGNMNQSSISFALDTTPPKFNINRSLEIWDNQSLRYYINATDKSGIKSFELNDTTIFEIDLDNFLINKSKLIAGNYSLNITAEDYVGNKNTTTLNIKILNSSEEQFRVEAQEPTINYCRRIIYSNKEYYLTNNITLNDDCIKIQTDNITLDCRGNWIIGDGYNFGKKGISLISQRNITIKNCNFKNIGYGIYIYDVSKVRIRNCSFEHFDKGIYGHSTDFLNIQNISSKNEIGKIIVLDSGRSVNITKVKAKDSNIYAHNIGALKIRDINISLRGSSEGAISLYECIGAELERVITHSSNIGIKIKRGLRYTLKNITIKNNYKGLVLEGIENSILTNSKIINNQIGLHLTSDTRQNYIFNNLFNNSQNIVYERIGINKWNTTLQKVKNIIGGKYSGGNYWGKIDGTGFSDTCEDKDRNEICDSPYVISNIVDNKDNYPLAKIRYGFELMLLSPIHGTKVEKGNGIIRLTFGIKDNSTKIKNCSIYINEELKDTKDDPKFYREQQSYSGLISWFSESFNNEGIYSWKVVCYDERGTSVESSIEEFEIVSAVSPVENFEITLISPNNNSELTNNEVLFNISGNLNISSCNLSINGSEEEAMERESRKSFTKNISLEIGEYNANISCISEEGMLSEIKGIFFKIIVGSGSGSGSSTGGGSGNSNCYANWQEYRNGECLLFNNNVSKCVSGMIQQSNCGECGEVCSLFGKYCENGVCKEYKEEAYKGIRCSELSLLRCSSYTTEEDCNKDSCKFGNCVWMNEKCWDNRSRGSLYYIVCDGSCSGENGAGKIINCTYIKQNPDGSEEKETRMIDCSQFNILPVFNILNLIISIAILIIIYSKKLFQSKNF